MSKRIVVSPEAESDIFDIGYYISQNNSEAADSFVNKLMEKFNLLAESPMMGRSRDELQPGLRSFSVASYLIFYRPIEEGIEVIRILYGGRDVESIFE